MSTDYQQAPAGLRVGEYELMSRLGEGGMGVVHLARRADGHRVALKVLRPHIVGDEEARERLAREVNSLGRIRSRWVAEIIDADPWGPVPFVATRYVPGLSLHDLVRDEGPVDDIAWFAARLADGLAAVHEVGVLHRDIKPSNVLMEGRAPILIDFGLARVADDPRLTHTGWLLGTPGYLAPEILHGDDAAEASDVHSWAATVAYAGTGHPPFGRGPSAAVMDRVRRGQHRLSGLDPRVRDLVADALSPEPGDRPTLGVLRRELSQLTEQVPPRAGEIVDAAWQPSFPPPSVERPAPTVPLARTPIDLGWFDDDDAAEEPSTHLVIGEDEETPARPEEPVDQAASIGTIGRRGLLTLGVWAAATAAIALTPYLALAVLALGTWLLRAGSLAGSSMQSRRAVRGPRWYDAVAAPLSYPWHLLSAVPGLVVLACWAGGLAVAAGLLAYAFAAPVVPMLLATGGVLLAAMWWGPGGSRLRGPVRRITWPLAAHPAVFCLVLTGLALAATAGVMLALGSGVDWSPADGAPLGSGSMLEDVLPR